MHQPTRFFSILALSTALTLGCQGGRSAAPAERIYLGGDIVTVDAQDRVAEGLAIREGRILAVGTEAEMMALRGPETQIIDLLDGAVLPGLIDGHGHLSTLARLAAATNVASPPVGPVRDIEQLLVIMRDDLERQKIPAGAFVVGNGYDDSLLAEGRHPTRHDLDRVSTEHPVVLLHTSLHLAAANTLALQRAGLDAKTPDPEGGVIRREADGVTPNGVLEETAMFVLLGQLPNPTAAQQQGLLQAAQRAYAKGGFTTVQEGAMGAPDFAHLRDASASGGLFVDVVGYPIITDAEKVFGDGFPTGRYQGRLKLSGVKLVLDGSPQGKTAWLSHPYHVPPHGRDADYRGYPWMKTETVTQLIAGVAKQGVQLIAHANGDSAADQLIEAVAAVRGMGLAVERPVMIHAQTVREDQLDRMQSLAMIPSFFSTHTFFWGDWHRDSVLGPERAARISPAATTLARGMVFTIHNDAPVVPPDGMRLLWSAVNRITRSGKVLGAAQRLSVLQAVRALTWNGAYQYSEENEKGSLEAGKRADLVVLERSPLRVDPRTIADIQVVATVKDGHVIYER